jgi:hypothetical protein
LRHAASSSHVIDCRSTLHGGHDFSVRQYDQLLLQIRTQHFSAATPPARLPDDLLQALQLFGHNLVRTTHRSHEQESDSLCRRDSRSRHPRAMEVALFAESDTVLLDHALCRAHSASHRHLDSRAGAAPRRRASTASTLFALLNLGRDVADGSAERALRPNSVRTCCTMSCSSAVLSLLTALRECRVDAAVLLAERDRIVSAEIEQREADVRGDWRCSFRQVFLMRCCSNLQAPLRRWSRKAKTLCGACERSLWVFHCVRCRCVTHVLLF